MDRIKNLSLDQKAKLYYMALLQKGMIDTLPEDPKAAYVKDMMGKMEETRDEEDEENDRNLAIDDIPVSLRELSTKLGYLKEIDLNAISAKKASFVYTEQGGRFYSLTLSTSDGQTLKMRYDEANEWLKDTLSDLDIDIPKRYGSDMKELDDIVEKLEDLGIEASHGDYMDVS